MANGRYPGFAWETFITTRSKHKNVLWRCRLTEYAKQQ